ncbi:MAG: hypothetical protein ACBR50_09115 [Microcoleus sp.]
MKCVHNSVILDVNCAQQPQEPADRPILNILPEIQLAESTTNVIRL